MKNAMIISCFDWYEKRIEPIADILKQDYNVQIYLSDFDHINKRKIVDSKEDVIYVSVPKYKKNISIKRIFSHYIFARKIHCYIKNNHPDLIYLLLPPNCVAQFCNEYVQKHSECKYILDIIDLWPESMPIGIFKRNILTKKWADMRNHSFVYADVIFVECDLYRYKLRDVLNGKEVITNYLYKPVTDCEADAIKREIKKYLKSVDTRKSNSLILGFVGSINNIIDINKIVEISRYLIRKGIIIQCRIIGDGEHKDELIRGLNLVGVDVRYYGIVFDETEKIQILGSCDYGLNIVKNTISVGLSIKSIDYLSYGIPLLNNVSGDTNEMIEKYAIGINIKNDYEDIYNKVINYRQFSKKDIYDFFMSNFSKEAFVERLKTHM